LPSAPVISIEAQEVLDLLRLDHNVIISGPPGTGKSRLLADVARGFLHQSGGPTYIKTATIAIPAGGATPPYLPSPHRKNRDVFSTALHSGTKPRDFLRGLVPTVDPAALTLRFEVSKGTLYRASEHALLPDGAALLMIDEINRGPAVALFGPSIVALESDKRLDDTGQPTLTTQSFEIMDDLGHPLEYELPRHLYIVAAMNQVDTSVEALDVAFLRRFTPYRLMPDERVVLAHFGLSAAAVPAGTPAAAHEVFATLIAAWKKVNAKLALGRGPEYQIGHGALMYDVAPTGLPEAIAYTARAWRLVRQHVDEIFFGDTRGVAEILAADRPGSPYSLTDTTFAGQPVVQLNGPEYLTGDPLLAALKAVAGA
jgi:5-methylcytosine-specific restriction protein B